MNNVPERTTAIALGDTARIERSRISDWLYVRNGILHGGHTIRLLRNRMPLAEQALFDAENGFMIEETRS